MIRALRDRYTATREEHVRKQIANLRYRIKLIRNMQVFGVSSFFLCVLCMFLLFAGQSQAGAFSFGHSAGVLDGVLAALGLPTWHVTATVWKRTHGLIGTDNDYFVAQDWTLAGGRIFLQVWHVGRVSHPALQPDGGLPVAPSAIGLQGMAFITDELGAPQFAPFVTPRALELEELLPGRWLEGYFASSAKEGELAVALRQIGIFAASSTTPRL